MTISEAVRFSTDKLKEIYDEGETEAIVDWVMEYLLKEKRTSRTVIPIATGTKKELTPEQVIQLDTILSRLLTHEPLQYVLNEAWFCGLKFYVDKNVLIPRPETEELVEWIITHCKFPIDTLRILDIGTGSGCIPVTLKRRLGRADVSSCDVSSDALEVARQNSKTMNVDINLIQLDFLSKEERSKLPSYDIIVSNPPYVPEKDKLQMQPNVLNYEPAKALFVPDNDPLVFYKAIADFGKDHLLKSGVIYVEIHKDLGAAVVQLFESNGYGTELKKDMQGNERMVRAFI
jgi:release factor glutamine methyltransferase